ncbi:MAG: Crp/Fnr family transcriptional regulator [Cyclobacteriaceae bacterium]
MLTYKNLFDQSFGKYINISEEAYAFLNSTFASQEFSTKEFIVEAGNVGKYFYFVQSGVQAMYLINRKGEKVVLGFSFGGSLSGVYDSFLYQKPSDYFLEALTPSRLIGINLENYKKLFDLFPEFNRWRIDFMESILFGRGKREVEMLTLTAKERFDVFMKRCPDELLQIPQKYLASYLNMKPETFSRLRALRD